MQTGKTFSQRMQSLTAPCIALATIMPAAGAELCHVPLSGPAPQDAGRDNLTGGFLIYGATALLMSTIYPARMPSEPGHIIGSNHFG